MTEQDDTDTGVPETPDPSDSEFVSESASVAFDLAPDDTTAGVVEDADEVVETAPVVAAADTSARAAEATGKRAPVVAGATPADAKHDKPLSPRAKAIKKEIDTYTHAKHQVASELAAEQTRLTTLRAEIATAERTRTRPKADATPVETTPVADLMPEHPKYRDFDTDEAYEAAVGEWRTKSAAWDQQRIDALKTEITASVEARFTSHDGEAAARQAETTLISTLKKVRTSKADWDEKADAMRDLQSAWYDPTTHQGSTTPFLSDLSQSLLMQGREDGAELLHWLGSDLERAQRVADLLPTRPLRDALVYAPSAIPLLAHFATPEGAVEFEQLKQMHPVRMLQAIGALSSRLAPVPRGSGAAAHYITTAHPSARPPAGTPGARAGSGGAAGSSNTFDEWMAAEDAREQHARERLAGIRSA